MKKEVKECKAIYKHWTSTKSYLNRLCTNIQFGGHWVLQQNKYFPLTDKLKGQAANPTFPKDRSSFRRFT